MSRPFERFDVPGARDGAVSNERGVRATRTIPAGARIMTTEPYAAALRAEKRESHCAWSFQPLRLGARARVARAACGAAFRDEESLKLANTVEAFERASAWVRKSSRGTPETSARCALQCLARRAGERDGTCERARYELLGEDARGFDGVWALRESRGRDGKSARELEKAMEIASAATVVAALAGEAMVKGATPEEIETKMLNLKVESGVDTQFVISLLSRFEINGFTIADDDMQRVGFGIYPEASLFNHSSTPNAQVMFKGKTLVVKTLREIAVGEEITISYGEQYMPREWTRRRMLSSYGFDAYAAYPKYEVAEAARRRVLDAATRTRLPMRLGELVDLGEDVCWYAGELLPDEDLARDRFWHQLDVDAYGDEFANSGIMLIKDESRARKTSDDDDDDHDDGWNENNEIMIWGKFPEHCDRELTAINFANAARSLELLGADGEDDDEDDDRDPVIALQGYEKVARALLSGDDKAAAVGRNHEILKHVNLKRTLKLTELTARVMRDFDERKSACFVAVVESSVGAFRACQATETVYKMSAGFSPFDSVYVHLKFQMLKLGVLALGYLAHLCDQSGARADYRKLARELCRHAILTHNELKSVMSKASCDGMVMHNEWSRDAQSLFADLSFIRQRIQQWGK